MSEDKEFMDLFRSLCTTHSAWEVWQAFISASAISISNTLDPNEERRASREKEYHDAFKRIGGLNVPGQMLGFITASFDRNPEQDFLGRTFMQLGLGSNWHGQFFTPYQVARMMADLSLNRKEVEKLIHDRGWISVSDLSCGAGATLIGAFAALKACKINPQTQVCFVGSDIDRLAAQMCYIQLSLLGCAGYVVVTDTLMHPVTGPSALFPNEQEGQEYWYTPMWWSDIWTGRRLCCAMDHDLILRKGNAGAAHDDG